MSKNPISTDGTLRRESVSEFEYIEFKPPIDKIADEFVRETNQNVLVELVCSEDDIEANNLKSFLEDLGYNVNKTDKDRKQMNNKFDNTWIGNGKCKT